MVKDSRTSFRRLIPLLRPHIKKMTWGFIFMVIYVSCWPLLARMAGVLIPAIGKGDLDQVTKVISLSLLIFLIQKIAQFLQDIFLAEPALFVSQDLRRELFKQLQKMDLGALEKLSSGDLTYRLTEDADRVGEVIYKTIQDTTPCILQLIAVYIYMLFIYFCFK